MDASLLIKHRDLHTGEERRETVAIANERNPSIQRVLIERKLAELCPDAVPRSFHEGVGTFLSDTHLIVVKYESASAVPDVSPSASRVQSTQPLFSS